MEIRQIDHASARDTRRFFDFPFHLYSKTPQWVPPMASERIGVLHNRNHNAYRKCKTAFFGFFESVEQVDVPRRLFGAACEWARARGLEQLIGPRGLMGSDGGGILVTGFEHRAALNENYNMPYYDRFAQDFGFVKDRDHHRLSRYRACPPKNERQTLANRMVAYLAGTQARRVG